MNRDFWTTPYQGNRHGGVDYGRNRLPRERRNRVWVAVVVLTLLFIGVLA